jgi:methionine aminopeptidase
MGYSVIREYGGHAIGMNAMHEKPHIPMTYDPLCQGVFEEGQVICIEPMLSPGNGKTAVWDGDGWTVYCPDRQPVAMFEVMAIVGKERAEVITNHLKLN